MIPIARPNLDEEEVRAATQTILSHWVTQGPNVAAFEENFAQTVGAKYACAVSSCTTALHLALLAIGIQPGNVVITVSHSFIATANAIRYCGAEPVFVDVGNDFNIDPVSLENMLQNNFYHKDNGKLYYRPLVNIITPHSPLRSISSENCEYGKLGAILIVHQMGIPCKLLEINKTCHKYSIPLIEDAACAIGSKIRLEDKWQWIGQPHSDIACFSFHPRKILTTGDGGMITTNKECLANKIRLLRHHGMSISDTTRHNAPKIMFEEYCITGFNYRMTDIQAAIGIEQLKKLDKILQVNKQLAQLYHQSLAEICEIDVFKESPDIANNWQSYPIKLTEKSKYSQEEIMQHLLDKGIATRRGIMNSHEELPYQKTQWSLPYSEILKKKTILLPLFATLKLEELNYIVATIKDIFAGKVS